MAEKFEMDVSECRKIWCFGPDVCQRGFKPQRIMDSALTRGRRANNSILTDNASFTNLGIPHNMRKMPYFSPASYFNIIINKGAFVYKIIRHYLSEKLN